MKKQGIKITLIILLLLKVSSPSFSQAGEKIAPNLQLQYFNITDEIKSLKATLIYSSNRMELPLPGMKISFYSGAPDNNLIGSVITDENGIAAITLSDYKTIPTNAEEFWTFNAEFPGNDSIEGTSAEISIKDLNFVMSLSEADSIKTITLNVTTIRDGIEMPVSGEIVMIYVPRMFSLLPVGEVTLNESGTASIEFPSDLPGDKEGMITIISKLEEHPDFGNIERKVSQKWGVPTEYSVPTAHRALWTKTPPMWMIVTLSILLTGVWGHYLFAIISLFLIKREAKRKKARDEYKL
jgi:hypothetical protein